MASCAGSVGALHADTPRANGHGALYSLPTALIRIELTHCTDAKTLTLLPTPGSHLTTDDGIELPAGTGAWTVTRKNDHLQLRDAHGQPLAVTSRRIRMQGAAADDLCGIGTNVRKSRPYRGVVEIALSAGHLLVINELPLEAYLRGVVPCEMGHAAPEALKAQAVAARTFAVNRLQRRIRAEYDLRDSTDSQVYGGAASETPECSQAVAATEGLILTSHQHPIDAQYCADCGGTTSPGSAPDECLPCVHDDDAHGPKEHPTPPVWTVKIPADRFLHLLHPKIAALPAEDAFPYDDFTPEITPHSLPETPSRNTDTAKPTMPTLRKIEAAETDASGRVRRVRCTFGTTPDAPTQTLDISGETLRKTLGADHLRSLLFKATCDGKGHVVFTGRGWGHGRGLCQTGAMALAAAPLHYDFQRILMRYYAGAVLTQCHYADAAHAAPAEEAPHGG